MQNKFSFISMRSLGILLAGLTWAGCINYPVPNESHYNRGVELYDQGKHAEAIDAYKLALRKNPDDAFAMYNLAVVYQDQGKYPEAIALYKKILVDTEDTNSRINLASIYYDRGDHDLAFKELDTAAEKNRDSAEPLSVRGEYLEREGSLDKAESKFVKALAIDDQHALTHFRLGRLYCNQKKTGPCLEKLEKAVELEPEVPLFLETLARQNETQGHLSEAIHLLERVSVLEPDRVDIFVMLGDLYKSERRYKNALRRYWSAIAIQDNNPSVHRSMAEIYDWLSDQEKQVLEKQQDQNSLAKNP